MKKALFLAIALFFIATPQSFADEESISDGNYGNEPGYVYIDDLYRKEDSNELKNPITPLFVPRETSIGLSVPYRQQVNNYYCGPACVKMVCDYYKNHPERTQYTYAKDLGTTRSEGTYSNRIPRVINKYITSHDYRDQLLNKGFQDFLDRSYYAIKRRAPIIANMRSDTLPNSSWPYKVSGHYVVVTSIKYDSNMKKFVGKINDPWWNSPKQYQVTYPQIYDVIMANHAIMIY